MDLSGQREYDVCNDQPRGLDQQNWAYAVSDDENGISFPNLQNFPEDPESWSDDMSFSSDDESEAQFSSTDGESDEEILGSYDRTPASHTDPSLFVIEPSEQIYFSSLKRSEHILAISAMATRHNLSQTAILDILDLIQIHIPDANIGLTSVSKLKDECGFGTQYLNYHIYCDNCKKTFDDNSNECPTPGCRGFKNNPEFRKYFVTSNLSYQLKEILERPGLWNLIEQNYNVEVNTSVISDVKSGSEYLKLKEPGNFLYKSSNITLTLFTDGIPLFSSSSVSLWPVYLIINELPPKERFQRTNMILWGIWQGVGKPKMCMFLKPLVLDLHNLYQIGMTFLVDGRTVSLRAMLILATMDLQARAYVLNMTQHNGLNGCLYCKEPGVVVASGKGNCRSYPYNESPILRSEEEARNSATLARNEGKRIDGFFGENVFMYLPYFSMTKNVTIDYMHGVLLGVTKKFLDIWFDSKHSQNAWYIGDKIKEVDAILKKIKPPYFIHRRPRILSNTYHHWKASELRNWLLFYALPCLNEYLPQVYLVHFSCLVEAVYILLSEGIDQSDLDRAEELLNAFCRNVAPLYMDNLMSLNVHNLTHLVTFVKSWGPLWGWSCFAFESFNGEITKAIHGTGNVCREVFWFLHAQKRVQKNVQQMHSNGMNDTKVLGFLERLSAASHKQIGTEALHCNVIKIQDLREDLHDDIRDKLREITNCDNRESFSVVAKIARNGFTMYSMAVNKVKKQNSYTLLLENNQDGADMIEVERYIMHNQTHQVFAVGRLMKKEGPILDRRVPHLQRVSYLRY